VEVSGVELQVEVGLDQQADSLRGPLAVRVMPGHPPPRIVPWVMGLLCCCCCSAPGVSPQGILHNGGVPGYTVCGPGWVVF